MGSRALASTASTASNNQSRQSVVARSKGTRWNRSFLEENSSCCGLPDHRKIVTRVREMKTFVVHLVTHNAVYLTYKCSGCKHVGNITVQLFREGLNVGFGRFEYNYDVLEEWQPPLELNVPDALYVAEFTNQEYALLSNNCKNFAHDYSQALKEAASSLDTVDP